jgi:hypothetical protein
LRVGFLVSPDNVGDVVAAARLNTFLWGGRYNPIIAVADPPNDARRMIADFRVDLLHPVAETEQIRELIAEHDHIAWPLGLGGLLARRGFENQIEPTLLDTVPAMVDAWSKEMRYREDSRFRSFRWEADDDLAGLFAVWFGEFEGDLGEYYRTVYENRLKAPTVSPREVDFGERDLFAPIGVTGAALDPDLLERDRVGIVIGDATNARDLASFWNLRAAGYRVDFFTGDDALDRGLVRHVRRRVAYYAELQEYERHIHLFLLHGDEIPPPLAEILGPDANPIQHTSLQTAWDHRAPPALFQTDSIDILVSEEGAPGTRVIYVPLTNKPFSDFRFDLTTQQWVVSVGAPVEAPLEDTLHLPYLPRLNGFYRQVTPLIHDVRVEHQRVGLITDPLDNRILLRPLTRAAVIAELLKLAGLEATQSSSGHRAHQIIAQLGHLQRCRVFRLPGVRKLVGLRAAHVGLGWRQAIQTITEGFAAVGHFYVSGEHLDSAAKVFRFLLSRRVFLTSYELVCPNCELPSLYPPSALDDEVRCAKCGATFLLAPAIGTNQWRYQLTGLLGQPEQHVFEHDHEERPPEAVGVLLTLAWLDDADAGADLLLDTNYAIRGDGVNGEVDVLAIERSRDGDVTVLVGECRTGGRFTERDVEKLEAIAERLRAARIHCRLLFATLRDELDDEEVTLLRAVRDRNRVRDQIIPRPPIVLTRRDLERGEFARIDELHGYYRGELARVADAADRLYLR